MTKKQIIDTWAKIRETNNSIPDDVLDFMKDASIEKIESSHERKSSWERTDEQILSDLKNGLSFGMK